MRHSVRLQLRWLRAWALATSLGLVAVATLAVRQAPPRNLGEITVERINVVDADGTLRLVISDKDRMHPGVMDGVTIKRPRPVAGLLFFNDQGDEVGGLTFTGREEAGRRSANTSITFDQLKQDQTIGFGYNEADGRRTAGFQVWDPPDQRLTDLIRRLNDASEIQDPARREAAVTTARAAALPRPRRVFVGRDADRAAVVSLADAAGTPRLTLAVDPAGNPRIEFRDEHGAVTRTIARD